MSDLHLPDRLTQLRSRWEADPASRIFLQLAEEYRHLGRLHEALAVLEAGLKEHPGYLSALVAKGRCLLELGSAEPAREVLERVVRQDATQAVANKLLVRAYLETGQAERARERLDLYSLLHDGDPEIEELRGRIRRLDAAGKAEPPRPSPAPPPVTAAPARPARGDDPFSLLPPARPATATPAPALAAVHVAYGEGEVFHLDKPLARHPAVHDVFELAYPAVAAVQALPEPPAPEVAPAEPEPVARTVEPMAASQPEPPLLELEAPDDDEPEPTVDGEPFPGLVSRAVRRRYLAGLAAESLFPSIQAPAIQAPAPVAVPPVPHASDVPEVSAAPEIPEALEVPVVPEALAPALPEDAAPGEIFPLRSIGEAVEAELRRSAPEPVPVPEPPEPEPPVGAAPAPAAPEPEAAEEPERAATVTLGDLYLRQGHLAEAEGIYREVLHREPGNAAAQAGLARIAASREPAAAAAAAMDFVPAAAGGGAGDRRSRKVLMLNSYLQRIRRGSHPDVP